MPILAVEYSGTHLKIIRPEVFYMSQSRTGLWWRLIRLSWLPGILTPSRPRPRRRTPCKRVTSITPTKDKMALRVVIPTCSKVACPQPYNRKVITLRGDGSVFGAARPYLTNDTNAC